MSEEPKSIVNGPGGWTYLNAQETCRVMVHAGCWEPIRVCTFTSRGEADGLAQALSDLFARLELAQVSVAVQRRVDAWEDVA